MCRQDPVLRTMLLANHVIGAFRCAVEEPNCTHGRHLSLSEMVTAACLLVQLKVSHAYVLLVTDAIPAEKRPLDAEVVTVHTAFPDPEQSR